MPLFFIGKSLYSFSSVRIGYTVILFYAIDRNTPSIICRCLLMCAR